MTTKAEFEDALQGWAETAAGVPAHWVRQKIKRTAPCLDLDLDGPETLSPAPERWTTVRGRDLVHHARDTEVWALIVQAHVAGGGTGDDDAPALLRRLKNSLKLLSTIETLRAAGATIAEVGGVRNVSAVIETGWQDRAVMTIRILTADVSTEAGLAIESVQGSGEQDLTDVTLDQTI